MFIFSSKICSIAVVVFIYNINYTKYGATKVAIAFAVFPSDKILKHRDPVACSSVTM